MQRQSEKFLQNVVVIDVFPPAAVAARDRRAELSIIPRTPAGQWLALLARGSPSHRAQSRPGQTLARPFLHFVLDLGAPLEQTPPVATHPPRTRPNNQTFSCLRRGSSRKRANEPSSKDYPHHTCSLQQTSYWVRFSFSILSFFNQIL